MNDDKWDAVRALCIILCDNNYIVKLPYNISKIVYKEYDNNIPPIDDINLVDEYNKKIVKRIYNANIATAFILAIGAYNIYDIKNIKKFIIHSSAWLLYAYIVFYIAFISQGGSKQFGKRRSKRRSKRKSKINSCYDI